MTAPNEDARRSIDILKKWGETMVQRWQDIRRRLDAVGLIANAVLPVGANAGIDRTFYVRVNKIFLTIEQAVLNPAFDIDTIPVIRRLTIDTLNECERMIEQEKSSDLKSKEERNSKLSGAMNKIVDEFGADIVQYGGAAVEKSDFLVVDIDDVRTKVGKAAAYTPPNPIFGVGPIGQLDEIERRYAADKARERLAEIQNKMHEAMKKQNYPPFYPKGPPK